MAARGASRPPDSEDKVALPIDLACFASLYVVVTEHPDVGVSDTSCC